MEHESPEKRAARFRRAIDLIEKWINENPEFDERVLAQLGRVGGRDNHPLPPDRSPHVAPDSVVAALRAADEAFGGPDPIFPQGDPRETMGWDELATLVLRQEDELAKVKAERDDAERKALTHFCWYKREKERAESLIAERDALARAVEDAQIVIDDALDRGAMYKHPPYHAERIRLALERFRAFCASMREGGAK